MAYIDAKIWVYLNQYWSEYVAFLYEKTQKQRSINEITTRKKNEYLGNWQYQYSKIFPYTGPDSCYLIETSFKNWISWEFLSNNNTLILSFHAVSQNAINHKCNYTQFTYDNINIACKKPLKFNHEIKN